MEPKSGQYGQASLEVLFLQAPFFLQGVLGSPLNINGILIEKHDAAPMMANVRLAVEHGVVTLASTDKLTFSQGDGTLDLTMQFSGRVEAVNEALSCILYTSKEEGIKEDLLLLEVAVSSIKGIRKSMESRSIPIRFTKTLPPSQSHKQELTTSRLSQEHLDATMSLALLQEGNTLLSGKEEPIAGYKEISMTSFSPSAGKEVRLSSNDLEAAMFLDKDKGGISNLTPLFHHQPRQESQKKNTQLIIQHAKNEKDSSKNPKLWIDSLSKEARECLEKREWHLVEKTKQRGEKIVRVGYLGVHPGFPDMALLVLEHEKGVSFCNPFIFSDLNAVKIGFDLLKTLSLRGKMVLVGFSKEGEKAAALIRAHGGNYLLRVAASEISYPKLIASFKEGKEIEVASWRLFMGASWFTVKVSIISREKKLEGWLHNFHDVNRLVKVERSQELAGKRVYLADYYILSNPSVSAASLARLLGQLTPGGMTDGEWFITVL